MSVGRVRCFGCGKFGRFVCVHCSEIVELLRVRVAKLYSTVEEKFAQRRDDV